MKREREREAARRLDDMRRSARLQLPSGSRAPSLPASRPHSMPSSSEGGGAVGACGGGLLLVAAAGCSAALQARQGCLAVAGCRPHLTSLAHCRALHAAAQPCAQS